MTTLTLNFRAYIRPAKDRELGQGNPQEFDSLALRWVQNQSLRLALILPQIGLGPTAISNERRHVLVGLVSGILRVRKEAHGPRSSPVWPALFQRCFKREQ